MFASKRVAREKFESVTHTVAHGVPVLDDALAWVACDLVELHPGGDHTIGIGSVIAGAASRASRWCSTAAVYADWRSAGPRATRSTSTAPRSARNATTAAASAMIPSSRCRIARTSRALLGLRQRADRLRVLEAAASSTVWATRQAQLLGDEADRHRQHGVEPVQPVVGTRAGSGRDAGEDGLRDRRGLARAQRAARTRAAPRTATRATRRSAPRAALRTAATRARATAAVMHAKTSLLPLSINASQGVIERRCGAPHLPPGDHLPRCSAAPSASRSRVLNTLFGPKRRGASSPRTTRTSAACRPRSSRASASGSAST